MWCLWSLRFRIKQFVLFVPRSIGLKFVSEPACIPGWGNRLNLLIIAGISKSFWEETHFVTNLPLLKSLETDELHVQKSLV